MLDSISTDIYNSLSDLPKDFTVTNTETFLIKAKLIHNNFYDYSLVKYIKSSSKIKIICPVHGIFEQTPNAHLSGQGCPMCSNNKISTSDEFIKKAKNIHGNKYDYSLVEYKNNCIKVKIICHIHGEFQQKPTNHLQGQGCMLCGINSAAENKRKTTKDFVTKARQSHGKKYDYTLVEYKGVNVAVKIICPIHGEFLQKPAHHLQGKGCQQCKLDSIKKKQRKTTEEFIKESEIIHNLFYSYENTVYINSKIKVEITCPIHGSFWQLPSNHLKGCGCPVCHKEKNLLEWCDRYKIGILYLLECFNETERFLKIGITSKTIQERYPTKERMPYEYKILYNEKGGSTDITRLELLIKRNFIKYTPLLSFGGSSTETFILNQKDLILTEIQNFYKNKGSI